MEATAQSEAVQGRPATTGSGSQAVEGRAKPGSGPHIGHVFGQIMTVRQDWGFFLRDGLGCSSSKRSTEGNHLQ